MLLFGSTSKVSFAGAGLAAMAGSAANIRHIKAGLAIQTIGPDKLNQLRHVRFFRDMAGIEAHMRKHAAILRPKFATVEEVLTRELGGTGVAEWSRPRGGYFISRRYARRLRESGRRHGGGGRRAAHARWRDVSVRS